MTISARQIRAARALLDWHQMELAARAQISKDSVKNIENGITTPHPSTMEKIVGTFEAEGVEFIEGGARLREDGIRMITGRDCYMKLLEDVHETLAAHDNTILMIWCADDKKSPPAVNDKYRAMRKDGIEMRQLVEAGNTYLMGALEEYRCIPQDNFTNVVKMTYADKHAVVNGTESRVIIHRDREAAESQRHIFNVLWDCLKKPDRSTADEKF